MDEVEVYKQQIKSIQGDVNSLELSKPIHYDVQKDFNEKSLELSDNIEHSSVGAIGMGFSSVYDLSSIPQRLILLGRLGRAMRFATTELRYKVDAAHAEIAEYIFAGLVIAVSPFHSVEDMKAYMAEYDALAQKLLGYPDMGLNDTANIYVRSDLDHKLHKARFMKYNELKDKPTHVIRALDSEIREVTAIRLRPQSTVAEIYQASDRLDQAVAVALNSEDYRATKYEIQDLKEAIKEAKRARRHGDKRKEVADAISYAQDELRLLRPSGIKVVGFTKTLQSLYK